MADVKIGDRVQFLGFGGQQVGTVERIGRKNVTVAYVSGAERKRAERFGRPAHAMRRSFRREAFTFLAVDSRLVNTWTASDIVLADTR